MKESSIGKIINILIVIIVIIFLGSFWIISKNKNQNQNLKQINQNNYKTINNYEVINNAEEKQIIKMNLTYNGYSPDILYAKKGIPIKWIVNVKQMSGCTNAIIMQDYNIEKKLEYGENIIEFTPQENGEIQFSCWMGMVSGKFIIT